MNTHDATYLLPTKPKPYAEDEPIRITVVSHGQEFEVRIPASQQAEYFDRVLNGGTDELLDEIWQVVDETAGNA